MHPYQKEFIEFCLTHNVLTFGDFTLKSGRRCPYFFNAGKFNSGQALRALGQFYAEAIQQSKIDYDVLFGPAYKGIPLVAAASIGLAIEHDVDKPYCFNRKEVKNHGEGGDIVGAPLKGRVLLIDDVITAGTAIRESAQLIQKAPAQLVGVIISVNRQERGQGTQSAIQEIQQLYQIPIFSIVTLQDIIDYMSEHTKWKHHVPDIVAYQKEWGIAA
jgi:orotate phosphoribosyltransferase